jgi:hypothetical protein
MHSNVMLLFMVQALQNPPLCSSTAVHGFRVHCTYLADYGGKYEGMVVAPIPAASLREEHNSKNHHHCHFKHNQIITSRSSCNIMPTLIFTYIIIVYHRLYCQLISEQFSVNFSFITVYSRLLWNPWNKQMTSVITWLRSVYITN